MKPTDPIYPSSEEEYRETGLSMMPLVPQTIYHRGIDLRTYIATACLQGLLSNWGNLYSPEETVKYACNCSEALMKKMEETK